MAACSFFPPQPLSPSPPRALLQTLLPFFFFFVSSIHFLVLLGVSVMFFYSFFVFAEIRSWPSPNFFARKTFISFSMVYESRRVFFDWQINRRTERWPALFLRAFILTLSPQFCCARILFGYESGVFHQFVLFLVPDQSVLLRFFLDAVHLRISSFPALDVTAWGFHFLLKTHRPQRWFILSPMIFSFFGSIIGSVQFPRGAVPDGIIDSRSRFFFRLFCSDVLHTRFCSCVFCFTTAYDRYLLFKALSSSACF